MAKFEVVICTDNAAFDEGYVPGAEVARILRTLADQVEGELTGEDAQIFRLRDLNGNRVGFASYTEGEE